MDQSPYLELNENQVIDSLQDSLKDSSKERRIKRTSYLQEIFRRIESNSFKNLDNLVKIALDTAVKYGHSQPESALIKDILALAIVKNEEMLRIITEYADGLVESESQLFVIFSKLVSELDHNKKKATVKTLVKFLAKSDALNRFGCNEVYDCLYQLGKDNLSSKILQETIPFLDSLEICPIVFSVRLCSEFADHRLLPQMIKVLDKSMKGFYNAHHIEIERRLCRYLGRIKDQNGLPHLTRLLRLRYDENPVDKSEAIRQILDSHPYLIDDLLDMLCEARDNKELVTAILHSIEKVKTPPSAMEILPKIHIRYWFESPARYYVKNILVKGGESSKSALFDMLRDDEKYAYALECLKEIGVSAEELSQVFPEPPILQIYNFLYSKARAGKMPKDLRTLWIEKNKLKENVPGTTDKLEHLVSHILSSFNFVTLNVAPLKLESVDVVGFYPETLNLLIISCTTGVLKDDLAKLDAMVNEMEKEMPDLFDRCTVNPIAVCSKDVSIAPSDLEYSREQGIAILRGYNIDNLLQMLSTNRKPRQVLRYIEECKWK